MFEQPDLYNADCMEAMKEFPDKFFDLAMIDPPYGNANDEVFRTGRTWANKYGTKIKTWDNAPGEEFFNELFRVSKNQVIWGGNYFSLPPTRCFLIWEKLSISEDFTMAMAEYAWTSFNSNAKVFEHVPQDNTGQLFHPTQKPDKKYHRRCDGNGTVGNQLYHLPLTLSISLAAVIPTASETAEAAHTAGKISSGAADPAAALIAAAVVGIS